MMVFPKNNGHNPRLFSFSKKKKKGGEFHSPNLRRAKSRNEIPNQTISPVPFVSFYLLNYYTLC